MIVEPPSPVSTRSDSPGVGTDRRSSIADGTFGRTLSDIMSGGRRDRQDVARRIQPGPADERATRAADRRDDGTQSDDDTDDHRLDEDAGSARETEPTDHASGTRRAANRDIETTRADDPSSNAHDGPGESSVEATFATGLTAALIDHDAHHVTDGDMAAQAETLVDPAPELAAGTSHRLGDLAATAVDGDDVPAAAESATGAREASTSALALAAPASASMSEGEGADAPSVLGVGDSEADGMTGDAMVSPTDHAMVEPEPGLEGDGTPATVGGAEAGAPADPMMAATGNATAGTAAAASTGDTDADRPAPTADSGTGVPAPTDRSTPSAMDTTTPATFQPQTGHNDEPEADPAGDPATPPPDGVDAAEPADGDVMTAAEPLTGDAEVVEQPRATVDKPSPIGAPVGSSAVEGHRPPTSTSGGAIPPAAETANPTADLVELQTTGLAERLRPAFAAVRRGLNGLDELRLRINDDNAGPIKVDIATVDNRVRVLLSAGNDDLMRQLGQERDRLADELRRAGFDQASIDVASGDHGRRNGRYEDEQESGQPAAAAGAGTSHVLTGPPERSPLRRGGTASGLDLDL